MIRHYEFSARAAFDLNTIESYYAEINPELARRFLRSVVSALHTACERPISFPEIRRGIHAVRCKDFPYRLYFEFNDVRLTILAVYHTSRDPRRWDDVSRD